LIKKSIISRSKVKTFLQR